MISEKFASITTIMNMQHGHVQKQLSTMEKQSEKMEIGLKELSDAFITMKLNESNQCLSCPNIREFKDYIRDHKEEHEKVAEKNKDLDFIARNPKLAFLAIVVAVILFIFTSTEYQDYKNSERDEAIREMAKTINQLKSETDTVHKPSDD
jgi:hypothetical protein